MTLWSLVKLNILFHMMLDSRNFQLCIYATYAHVCNLACNRLIRKLQIELYSINIDEYIIYLNNMNIKIEKLTRSFLFAYDLQI